MSKATPVLNQIRAFLQDIGIAVVEESFSAPSFLPGILIDSGTLKIDPAQLLYPGDMLHEAGHIAVTVPAERSLLQNDVTADRPDKQGDEMAVLLWTFAACQKIGLPYEVVFHPDGYKGSGQWLIDTFVSGNYIGLPLLVWMGMTETELFPKMTYWLRQ